MSEKETLQKIYADLLFSKPIEDAVRFIEKRGILRVGDVCDPGKVVLAELLRRKTGKKVLLLSHGAKEYRDYAKSWRVDNSSLDSRDFLCQNIVLAGFDDVFQNVVSLEEYTESVLELDLNGEMGFAGFVKGLSSIGYERVKKPGMVGEFGVAGDTVTVIVREGEALRVEFFGEKIEKMSLLRGDKKKDLPKTKIPPRTFLKGDDILLSYFDGYILLVDGEDRFRSHLFSFFEDDSGKVDEKGIEKMRKLEVFLKKQNIVYLEEFSVREGEGLNLGWIAPKRYYGNTKALLEDLKREKTTYIFSEKADSIKKFLLNNEVKLGKSIFIEKEIGFPGISFVKEGMNVLGDREIFWEQKGKKKKKIDFSAITNLKKGEYVVHIDHGIGVFTGFGELTVDGVKREYIFIEYEKGDKIYVPLDQADKITKYVSAGNNRPNLSSLKTAQWIKTRNKVRENVEKIAKELIENQALRIGEKKFHYLDDSKEQAILQKTFPYKETPDQRKSIFEVLENMNDRKPMDRLLCGDVGYGKTEVAIRATLRAVISGGQVAVLAPTTILAEQHLQTFRERLDQFGIRVESLSRFGSKEKQKGTVQAVAKGEVDVVIGTHRLLSKDIKFKNIYLIMIDEEQKFGVTHKEKLKILRDKVDILTMTATPIPRTLYMGLSGLKDISLITTPPEGRLPVKTVVIKNDEGAIKDAISNEVKRGGQVYFVHNRVETIQAFRNKLEKMLPKVKFVVGHGQMAETELAKVMNNFAGGKYDVLICSTIIESGLDISTVNTLIVDKATNFGLSQLHQLRGRIGRSHTQAYAYLLYDREDLKGNAAKRLKTIVEKGDLGSGYELSLEDLDIRGSGNILGNEQHGSMQMVGVGYYLRMLDEAVSKLKEKGLNVDSDKLNTKDIKIDLPVSAYIPDGFYEKEEDKIRAYQQLAEIQSEEELETFIGELYNSFETKRGRSNLPQESEKLGEIPEEYKGIIDLVRIKIKAAEAGITAVIAKDVLAGVDSKKKKLVVEFDHAITKQELREFLNYSRDWQIGSNQLKIDLKDLGHEWFRKIFLVISSLGAY